MVSQIKVAIVGSGPAGLICATKLVESNNNVKVIVFDELKFFGGIPTYCIPEFRIPLKKTMEQIEEHKKLGIKFVQKRIESFSELLKEFDFVVIAIGAGKGLRIGLEGEDSKMVIDGLDFLRADKLENKFLCENEKVAVIGGGSASIDVARVAKKQGADTTIIYRRTEKEMPIFNHELEEAKKEGVKFSFLKSPIKYVGENNKI